MNGRIWLFGSAAVAAAALVVIAIVLVTRNDTGAQLTPSSSQAQPPQSAAPAQAGPGTLLITRISEPKKNYDIYLVRTDGTGLRRLTAGTGNEENASWSADGTRIVYNFRRSGGVWVMNADGSGVTHLGAGWNPSWSPDGKRILYWSDAYGLAVMNADGSGVRVVTSADYATWAPNGKIVFVRPRTEDYPGGGDLYAVNADGSGLERLTKGASVMLPSVSPDGSAIAAWATRTDRLIVVPYKGGGPAVTLLARAYRHFPNGGLPLARWAPDGKALVLGSSNRGESGGGRLYIVNADGSGLRRVPGVTQAICPDWRPSPSPSASPRE